VLKYIKAMVAQVMTKMLSALSKNRPNFMMRASSYVGSRSSVETGYGNMLTNVNVMLVSTIAQIARPMNPTLLKISHFFIKAGARTKKLIPQNPLYEQLLSQRCYTGPNLKWA